MAATTASTALTMKLLVESSPLRRRVVFAEAGKDTVDFLFSLLATPAGTAAVKLLGKESFVGCTANLYGSAKKLDDAYVHPNAANKDAILCATVPYSPAATAPNSCLLYRLVEPPALPPDPILKRIFNWGRSYWNSSCRRYVTEVSGTRCASCGTSMTSDTNNVGSPAPVPPKKGFVQGRTVTYTVTDDLVITPMSSLSSIALLNACAVRDLGSLQERTVQIGYKEGLEILKASQQSKTVLTDVFLSGK
ncbi:unnamed protein product [Urochloa decumbens]|uniref:Uncharacterized protein n=1 Tax=Urochloa decumbens TaxID=240449 RepID=A0ABC9ASP6_9POAL